MHASSIVENEYRAREAWTRRWRIRCNNNMVQFNVNMDRKTPSPTDIRKKERSFFIKKWHVPFEQKGTRRWKKMKRISTSII